MNRRQFLSSATAAGASLLLTDCGESAMPYDLVIRGGRVIDPAQGIDVLADVAVLDGKIAAVGAGINAAAAKVIVEASGKLVVPGLIDMHVHARDAELPPSEFLSTGVTTMVDAGSRGAENLPQLIEIAKTANRMRILLNIAKRGNQAGANQRAEFLDGLDLADVGAAKAAVDQHRDWVIGMKARLSRGIAVERDIEVLKLALEVAEHAKVPLMIHIGDTAHPLPQLMDLLRPGDIVTHMCAPTPNTLLDANGKVLPEVRAARERGIKFDFANGLNEHWAWNVAQAALEQDFLPDTITTDLTVAGRTQQVFDLPNVVSKWLLLGMPLNDALARVTVNPSKIFPELNPYGSLRADAVADITVLEMVEGDYDFVDNYKTVRMGTQRLFTRAVVAGGQQVV